MSWKPIVVGVNGSEDSVRAAAIAAVIATRAGVACVPVFAGIDYARVISRYGLGSVGWMTDDAIANDREQVVGSLRGIIPERCVGAFESRTGPAPVILAAAARRWGAGLIVIGSRRARGRLDRIGHDTAAHLVRACDIPLLVTSGGSPMIKRILAVVDLSAAACATIEAARDWGRLFQAPVRVMHALEPLPGGLLGRPGSQQASQRELAERRALEISIRAMASKAGMESVLRRGPAAATILREVARFRADLLVLGAHGRGFVDRLLIGSTTERLLRRMPTMTLVVPAGRLAAGRPMDVESLPWEECEVLGARAPIRPASRPAPA